MIKSLALIAIAMYYGIPILLMCLAVSRSTQERPETMEHWVDRE